MGPLDGNSNGLLWYSLSVSQQRAVQRSPVDPRGASARGIIGHWLNRGHLRDTTYVASDHWKLLFLISEVRNVLNSIKKCQTRLRTLPKIAAKTSTDWNLDGLKKGKSLGKLSLVICPLPACRQYLERFRLENRSSHVHVTNGRGWIDLRRRRDEKKCC